jgi:3-dehydroquinate synthase
VYTRLPILEENIDDILEWLKFDKKNKGGELRFSLLEKIGQGVFDISIAVSVIKTALLNYIPK